MSDLFKFHSFIQRSLCPDLDGNQLLLNYCYKNSRVAADGQFSFLFSAITLSPPHWPRSKCQHEVSYQNLNSNLTSSHFKSIYFLQINSNSVNFA